jgi:hypothetical protein
MFNPLEGDKIRATLVKPGGLGVTCGPGNGDGLFEFMAHFFRPVGIRSEADRNVAFPREG